MTNLKTEIIEDFKKLQTENPDRKITRDFFRQNSGYSERTWLAEFGSFSNLFTLATDAAGPIQKQILRNIATHSSREHLDAINAQRVGWEGKYLRPSDNRWQTILCGADIHDYNCDPFYRRTFIETAARAQPEKIVLNGDIFDLPEFSKHVVDPRNYDVVGRIKWVHEFLADLRAVAPNTEIIFVEGNHEYRLSRFLAENAAPMVTLLSDLHGWTIPKLFGLEKYEVNYIARGDLKAFRETDVAKELCRNYYIGYDNSILFYHYPHGINMGIPGVNGHHHNHTVQNRYSPVYGPWEWHQLGGGHIRRASYGNGERWSNGFILCHVDTHKKRTQFEYIDTTHEHCIIGGKFYERTKEELVVD